MLFAGEMEAWLRWMGGSPFGSTGLLTVPSGNWGDTFAHSLFHRQADGPPDQVAEAIAPAAYLRGGIDGTGALLTGGIPSVIGTRR